MIVGVCVRIDLNWCITQLKRLLLGNEMIRVAAQLFIAKVLNRPGLWDRSAPDGIGDPMRIAGQQLTVLNDADNPILPASAALPNPAFLCVNGAPSLDPAPIADPTANALPRGLNEVRLGTALFAMEYQFALSYEWIAEVFSRLTSLIWLPVASTERSFSVSHVSRHQMGVE